eukprot:tig00020629_g12480.t1
MSSFVSPVPAIGRCLASRPWTDSAWRAPRTPARAAPARASASRAFFGAPATGWRLCIARPVLRWRADRTARTPESRASAVPQAGEAPADGAAAVEKTVQEETLELLEWSRVCEHLATFAATKLGAAACRALGPAGIPAATREESERLLGETREVYEIENRWGIDLKYEGIRDIAESVKRVRIEGYVLTGRELYGVATTLAGARALRRQIEGIEGAEGAFPSLLGLVEGLTTHPDLERTIKNALDPEGMVEDRASPKLAQIRARKAEAYGKARDIMQRCLVKYKDALQARPAAVTVNNALRQLARAEEEAVREVLLALSDRLDSSSRPAPAPAPSRVWPDISTLVEIVTALDCATARARYARWLRASAPALAPPSGEGAGRLYLTRCRHPLLVWQHEKEGGPAPVPIDVALAPGLRVVTITGPNTGGKTVALKTLS